MNWKSRSNRQLGPALQWAKRRGSVPRIETPDTAPAHIELQRVGLAATSAWTDEEKHQSTLSTGESALQENSLDIYEAAQDRSPHSAHESTPFAHLYEEPKYSSEGPDHESAWDFYSSQEGNSPVPGHAGTGHQQSAWQQSYDPTWAADHGETIPQLDRSSSDTVNSNGTNLKIQHIILPFAVVVFIIFMGILTQLG